MDLLIPSSVRLALVLELDLRLPAEDMPIKGSNVFLVHKDSIPPTWFQVRISESYICVRMYVCIYVCMVSSINIFVFPFKTSMIEYMYARV